MRRLRQIFFIFSIATAFTVLVPAGRTAYAQEPLIPCSGVEGQPDSVEKVEGKLEGLEPCNTCHFFGLFSNIVNFISKYVIPPLAVILIAWGGVLYLISGAVDKKAEAKKLISSTVIGVVLVYASFILLFTFLNIIVGDDTELKDYFSLTRTGFDVKCKILPPPPRPTTTSGSGTFGNCKGVTCSDGNLPICGSAPSADCATTAVNSWNASISAGIGKVGTICSRVDAEKLIKAVMSQESSGKINSIASDGLSFGLMHLKPETARNFTLGCTTDTPTKEWLLNPANAEAQICIATKYLRSLAASGRCGCDLRQLVAGYNGGPGACEVSTNCGPAAASAGNQCAMCAGAAGPTKRWECLWEDNQHQTCNANRPDNLTATRRYVPKVSYCYSKF